MLNNLIIQDLLTDHRIDKTEIESIELYHFTPAHMIEAIKQEGLTLGILPILLENGSVMLIHSCQWLTSDSSFDNQSWATKNSIEYDRTAFRLSVTITKKNRLIRAIDLLPQFPKSARGFIEGWKGSENWYLYFGNIPSEWIGEVEERGGA